MNWFRAFWKAFTTPAATQSAAPPETPRNFSPHAQQVLALARKEADRFHHNFIGTEHLLLGLIRLGQGKGVAVLRNLGLDLETVRAEVEQMVGTGPDDKFTGNIPYTPRVKKVLALAAEEAAGLNYRYVGTEHILLGLLREGGGVASRVLNKLGVETDRTRQEVLRQLAPSGPGAAGDPHPPPKPQNPAPPKSSPGAVDTSKRYDVYCWGMGQQQVVVYRNALFKGRSKLLSTGGHDFGLEFLELEQPNGHIVYVSTHSVLRFCEHGAEILCEVIPPPRESANTSSDPVDQ